MSATFGYSAYELACLIGDEETLKYFVEDEHRRKRHAWKQNLPHLVETLSLMPDFELQVKWSCDSSWIPFLKNFCPSENYWILKRGTEWRLCNGSYPVESTMRPTHDCS